MVSGLASYDFSNPNQSNFSTNGSSSRSADQSGSLTVGEIIFLSNNRIYAAFQDPTLPEKKGLIKRTFPLELFVLRTVSFDFVAQKVSAPFKFVSTPLSKVLTNIHKNGFEENMALQEELFGFLSLEESRRLYPIECFDKNRKNYWLVGVWIFSRDKQPDEYFETVSAHSFLWGLCADFTRNTKNSKKYSFSKEGLNFILAIFSNKEPPSFYSVTLENEAKANYKLFSLKTTTGQEIIRPLEDFEQEHKDLEGFFPKRIRTKLNNMMENETIPKKNLGWEEDNQNQLRSTNKPMKGVPGTNDTARDGAHPFKTYEEDTESNLSYTNVPFPQKLDTMLFGYLKSLPFQLNHIFISISIPSFNMDFHVSFESSGFCSVLAQHPQNGFQFLSVFPSFCSF